MKISDKDNPCKFLEENYIALDMAIKALEQDCSMDDLISRQAVIDAIRAFYDEYIVYNSGRSIVEMLRELPSAQAENIMCKDCKHCIDHNCYEGNHINIGLFVHDNNYCVWAERRNDDSISD